MFCLIHCFLNYERIRFIHPLFWRVQTSKIETFKGSVCERMNMEEAYVEKYSIVIATYLLRGVYNEKIVKTTHTEERSVHTPYKFR